MLSAFDHESMDKKNLAITVKQAGWSFSGKIISQVLQFINGVLIANILGPFSLGLYQLAYYIQLFLVNFAKLGLDLGLAKFIPATLINKHSHTKALLIYVLRVGFLISTVCGALLIFFSNSIAVNIFKQPELDSVLRIMSFLLPLLTLNFLIVNASRGAKDLRYNVLIKYFLHQILYFFILVAAYRGEWDLYSLLIAIVLREAVVTALLFFSLSKTFPFSVKIRNLVFDLDPDIGISKRELYDFSIPLLFQGLIFYLLGTMDILMIGYFKSAEMVGLYSIALKIALPISFILYSFNEIFMPIVAEKFVQNDIKGIQYLYRIITKWVFYVSLLIVGLIFLLNKEMLYLFGDEFLPAALPLLVLCIGQAINASVGGVGVLLETMGHQKLALVNAIILLVLNVILNYLLIVELDLNILGAAIATSISLALVNIIRLLQIKILRGLHPYNFGYVTVILSLIPGYGITYYLLAVIDTWFVWRLLYGAFLFISISMFTYYIIGMTEEDKYILKKIGDKIHG